MSLKSIRTTQGIVVCWKIGLLVSLLAGGIFGQTGSINLTVGDATVEAGERFTLPVLVSDLTGEGIISFQFTVSYPPERMTYQSYVTQSTLSSEAEKVADNPDTTNGTVNIGGIFLNPIEGSGALLRIQFDTNSSGSAEIQLSNVVLNTTTIADTEPGTVDITSLPSLSVSPDNFSVNSSAGSLAIEVDHNGETDISWSAAVVQGSEWLSIQSETSGTNQGTVLINYEANTASQSREGRIRVSADGVRNSPQTVTVSQAGSDSDTGSPTGLSVNPATFSVGSGSGSVTAQVLYDGASDISWTSGVVSGDDWLSIQSGASGTNGGEIVIRHDANSTAGRREGSVEVAMDGQAGSRTISISQSGSRHQEITLNKGWNIISFNIVPSPQDLLDLFQPLIDRGTLQKVQDEKGAAIEYLDTPIHSWINGIGEWDREEGYYIKVADTTTFTATGSLLPLPVSITLKPGGNIHSFPQQSPVNARTFYDPLIKAGVLTKVQDEQGAALEYIGEPLNQWINGIGNLRPGEGYYVTVSDSSTLNIGYNQSTVDRKQGFLAKSSGASTTQNHTLPVHFQSIRDTTEPPYSPMNIYATPASAGLLEQGDEIGVFNRGRCVGTGIFEAGSQLMSIVVGGDDPSTEKTDGFISGNTPKVVFWDKSAEKEYTLSGEHYRVIKGTNEFKAHSTVVLEIIELPEEPNKTEIQSLQLQNNYPDPFNSATKISFTLPDPTHVTISLYNIKGELVRTLIDTPLEGGMHTVTWDGKDHRDLPAASGMYMYQIRTPNHTKIKKCTLIR